MRRLGMIAIAIAMCVSAARGQASEKSELMTMAGVMTGCGEDLALSGWVRSVVKLQAVGSGWMFQQHVGPHGEVAVVGLESGTRYQAVGNSFNKLMYDPQGGLRAFTFINTFNLIGTGPAANLKVHYAIHVQFEVGGLVTGTELVREVCK